MIGRFLATLHDIYKELPVMVTERMVINVRGQRGHLFTLL